MKIKLTALFLWLLLFLASCAGVQDQTEAPTQVPTEQASVGGETTVTDEERESVAETSQRPSPSQKPSTPGEGAGVSPEKLGVYDGYFSGGSANLDLECLTGTKGAYKLEGDTLTFTAIDQETVYAISGRFRGNIVIDVGDNHKFELEFHGFSMISDAQSPITVLSGEEVALKAKKDYDNYIYDDRAAIDSSDETLRAGAISSDVDLEIGGKGKLTVVSKNNNGIHTNDDLQVKNLTLLVTCADNALKGNDSVTLTGGALTLIAKDGDGIKTSNTDFSSKGKQRGNVSITGGIHTVYAASDGIDAAYNVTLDDSTTQLKIYTNKYSDYSKASALAEETAGQDVRSSNGICAGNVIVVSQGEVSIKSHGTALYANKNTALENGASPIGNVTVNGGSLTLYSDGNGIHADGTLKIVAGTVNVTQAKRGLDAAYLDVYGGTVSICAQESGMNATASMGDTVKLRGGTVYINSKGDGIRSASETEYRGILMTGGRAVILSSGLAVNAPRGYTYEGGVFLAVMPQSDMPEKAVNCLNFENVGKLLQSFLSRNQFLTATIGEARVTLRISEAMDAHVLLLGDAAGEIAVKESADTALDHDGVAWQ